MIYELTKAYQEPHRFYHTLEHINYMLCLCRKLGWELTKDLCYAIWFHDAIYIPGDQYNEMKSTLLLDHFLFGKPDHHTKLLTDDDRLFEEVKHAILSTKDHIPRNELATKLIDLDLAILAEDSTLSAESFPDFMTTYHQMGEWPYMTYLKQVRREFHAATDEQWADGRSKWIRSMLRKEIFCIIKDKEVPARYNLEGELKTYERYQKLK